MIGQKKTEIKQRSNRDQTEIKQRSNRDHTFIKIYDAPLPLPVKVNSTYIKHKVWLLVLSIELGTVQNRTGKVSPARKFKCTTRLLPVPSPNIELVKHD